MANWHGLAKLRMHHNLTVALLDKETTVLGEKFRDFADRVCPVFDTKELKREFEARVRHGAAKKAGKYLRPRRKEKSSNAIPVASEVSSQQATIPTSVPNVSTQVSAAPSATPQGSTAISGNRGKSTRSPSTSRQKKEFSLDSYKFHSYGDYASSIEEYGTTDSYSTESVRTLSL